MKALHINKGFQYENENGNIIEVNSTYSDEQTFSCTEYVICGCCPNEVGDMILTASDIKTSFYRVTGIAYDSIVYDADPVPVSVPIITDNSEQLGVLCNIIEVFEDFLDDRGIVIENDDKDDAIAQGEDPECIANIYGCDYGELEDRIRPILERLGLFAST